MKIIGLDFSINKPAACIYQNNQYTFYSWPFNLSERLKTIYRDVGINLIDRTDEKYKGTDSSEKMRWEVSNAMYISDQIILDTVTGPNISEWQIVFEGLSYGSSGNVAIQLGGYKYILMKAFYEEGISFKNMTTYAPITLKKTANCAKKGMGKAEMIQAFIDSNEDMPLRNALEKTPNLFQKKTGTWIDHLDDLVDSYWAIKTFISKQI